MTSPGQGREHRSSFAEDVIRLERAERITDPDWVAHVRAVRPRCVDGASAEVSRADPHSETPQPARLPELRITVPIPPTTRSVLLDITALGTYRVQAGGRDADTACLEPGYSDDRRRVAVRTLDLTPFVRDGALELAVEVGPGVAWLAPAVGRYEKFRRRIHAPAVRALLSVEDVDGHVTTYPTGPSWRAYLSATTAAHWHCGEDHDQRRHEAGPGVLPAVIEPDGAPEPWRRNGEPVQVVNRRGASELSRHELADGAIAVVLDAGTNLAGRYVVDLSHAHEGQVVTVRPAELLGQDGLVDQSSTGSPIFDRVTARGGPLVWSPRHVYHGFRYLQVEGLDATQCDEIATRTIVEVMRAGVRRVGAFTCDLPDFDRLHRMIDRAVQSNTYSVMTDCPHREKLGWLEELDLCFETLTRGYDLTGVLRDALVHMRDSQDADGCVPSTVPELVRFEGWPPEEPTAFRDDPSWGGAIVHVPWHLYELTGDLRDARESWPTMLRLLDHLNSRADDEGILDYGLGDWIEVSAATPRALVATCAYLRVVRTMADVAHLVGASAEPLLVQAEFLRSALRSRFLAEDGTWGNGSQASWALAIDSGAAGPGYGRQIASGATALTESWQGPSADDGVNSQNHFMLGVVDSWLTGHVAGLRRLPGTTGWSEVVVDPARVPDVGAAATTFDSPGGRWSVRWHATGTLVAVPEGGRATIGPGVQAHPQPSGEPYVLTAGCWFVPRHGVPRRELEQGECRRNHTMTGALT